MKIIIWFVLFLVLVSCAHTVRYDGAPSPLDINRHTVLLEIERDGVTHLGYGQIGMSYGHTEVPHGKLFVHTPLPGSVFLYSERCGISEKGYHAINSGPFHFDMEQLFGQVPPDINACIVNVLVSWELPPRWTSDYPLRGMSGRLYFRRRMPNQSPATLTWYPQYKNIGPMVGVGFGQFRAVAEQPLRESGNLYPIREPLLAVVKTTKPVVSGGKYRLFGCGQPAIEQDFVGDEIRLTRAQLIGENPQVGNCQLLGWIKGIAADGSPVENDIMIGVEIFGSKAQLLSAEFTATDSEVCYAVENSVTGCVLNFRNENSISGKLQDCFKKSDDAKYMRMGCWTHKGRAVYGIIDENGIEVIH